MKNIDIVAAYDDLVKKALEIVRDAPYWSSVFEEDFARLEIDDKGARLRWPEDETYYDSSTIETRRTQTFDPALLHLSGDELKAWKKEQRALYEREQKEREKLDKEAARINREHQERVMYEALKKKYGQ